MAEECGLLGLPLEMLVHIAMFLPSMADFQTFCLLARDTRDAAVIVCRNARCRLELESYWQRMERINVFVKMHKLDLKPRNGTLVKRGMECRDLYPGAHVARGNTRQLSVLMRTFRYSHTRLFTRKE